MSTHRLSIDLEEILRKGEAAGPSLREAVATVGDRGYGLLLVILALPSAMPVPAPGYSTPFGIALFLVGLQVIAGRSVPWLPKRLLDRRISSGAGRRMISFVARLLERLERWVRPRCEWVFARWGQWACGFLILFMAFLMIFPIPLTNTAPAGVVFFLGIAMVERDGFLFGFSAGLGILAALLYLAAFYAIFYFGLQGMEEIREIIRNWMGG